MQALTAPRLASSVQVSAFIRLAAAGGDFAAVLRKGDAVSGAILVVGLVRGEDASLYERLPLPEGGAQWQQLGSQNPEIEIDITLRWQKQATRDPDLWVIELDAASPERLAELLVGGA